MDEIKALKLLGLKNGATETQINSAYRKEALKWHPDKNPGNKEEATAKFRELNNAKELLMGRLVQNNTAPSSSPESDVPTEHPLKAKLYGLCSKSSISEEEIEEIKKILSRNMIRQPDIDRALEATLKRPFVDSDVYLHEVFINMNGQNKPSQGMIEKLFNFYVAQADGNESDICSFLFQLSMMKKENRPSQNAINKALSRLKTLPRLCEAVFLEAIDNSGAAKISISPQLIFERCKNGLSDETLFSALDILSQNKSTPWLVMSNDLISELSNRDGNYRTRLHKYTAIEKYKELEFLCTQGIHRNESVKRVRLKRITEIVGSTNAASMLNQQDIDEALTATLRHNFSDGDVELLQIFINMRGENKPSQEVVDKVLEFYGNREIPNKEIIKVLLSMRGENGPSQQAIDKAFNSCSRTTEASNYLAVFSGNEPSQLRVSSEFVNKLFKDRLEKDKNALYINNLFFFSNRQLTDKTLLEALGSLNKRNQAEQGQFDYARFIIAEELLNRDEKYKKAIAPYRDVLLNDCRSLFRIYKEKAKYLDMMLNLSEENAIDKKIITHIRTLEKEKKLLPEASPSWNLKTKKIEQLESILLKPENQRVAAIRDFNSQRSWREWMLGSRTSAAINNTRTWQEWLANTTTSVEDKKNDSSNGVPRKL